MKHTTTTPSALIRVTLTAAVCALACQSFAQSAPAAPEKEAQTPAALAAQKQSLSLKALVEKLRASNKTIRSKQAEGDIAATGIERAASAFQPLANLSAAKGKSITKNTFEESMIRQGTGLYDRQGQDYSVGVSKLLAATGAKLEVKSALSRFVTNIPDGRPEGTLDNRSNLGFSITQPLARDAGPAVTTARLQVATLDATAADHATRDTETSVVAEAIMAYHEMVFAQHRVQAAQEKIRNGQRLLVEAQAINRNGRLPDSDVWEVENALNRFKAGLSEAQQVEREKINRVRTMLLSVAADSPQGLVAVDALPAVADKTLSADESLRTAMARRDDYLMRKVQAEREGVQLAYTQNQTLPRVDLVASYGMNGLEYAISRAYNVSRMSDYPTWSVGLQVSIPLGRNMQAQSDLKAALIRREDALLGLKSVEVQISNDIDTTLSMRSSAVERWDLWKQVHAREKQQLELERRKFTAGRSDTREVLLREERVINAQLTVYEQQMAVARAEVLLDAAQGTLLDSFADPKK